MVDPEMSSDHDLWSLIDQYELAVTKDRAVNFESFG